MLDTQRQKKREMIKNIETQIQKQNQKIMDKKLKINKDKDSLSSMSMSNISLESKTDIKNGLEILVFTLLKNVKNKKIDFFTRLMGKRTVKKYFRKRSSKKQIFTATYTGKLSKKKCKKIIIREISKIIIKLKKKKVKINLFLI